MPEHTETLKEYDCHTLIKQQNWRKKEDCIEIGTNYEHQEAKDCLTQELKELLNNNKNYCIQTFLQDLTPT
jgi:hypothetical protein